MVMALLWMAFVSFGVPRPLAACKMPCCQQKVKAHSCCAATPAITTPAVTCDCQTTAKSVMPTPALTSSIPTVAPELDLTALSLPSRLDAPGDSPNRVPIRATDSDPPPAIPVRFPSDRSPPAR